MILAESPLSRCSSGMSGLTGKMRLNKAVSPNQKKKPAYVTKKDYDYLILVSSDGIKFHLRRELAYTSGTIRAMMNGPSNPVDDQQNVVHFRSIPFISYTAEGMPLLLVQESLREL
ncbi:hypothetical protein RB195_003512 [Necator americanus]|uniref:SKP1 component POZ domain-containing protein n=1 Tax=Necator americanus TaxID=51031 RepID=A0ABR1DNX2_NECAM